MPKSFGLDFKILDLDQGLIISIDKDQQQPHFNSTNNEKEYYLKNFLSDRQSPKYFVLFVFTSPGQTLSSFRYSD